MTPLEALSARWPEISALLDEALALPPSEHPAWLEALAGDRAPLRATLRELLEAHARAQADDAFGGLPAIEMAADAADEPAAGDEIGPYRLISELGRGGMGTVWLAERADGLPRRAVALKLPRLAWGGALAQRLARERDILATLAHPHIARLYDAGVDRHGRPYLAMEHVQGQAIDDYCRERALPLRDRLVLLLQVCAAVAHAHAKLVVHRDLKPSNILVTEDGQVRLLDFGVAKLMEGDKTAQTALTQVSGRALTLDYASPEQIRGEPLDTASDVYSLAVVAYELLTGARPYRLRRGSAAELEEAIASTDPPPASVAATEPALKKKLRGDLDAILNKALKKDAAKRYATVEAFAQDLQRHLAQQPVMAQPDSFGYRAGKFVRRHRLQVGAGGAVALALLAGAGAALWQAHEARLQAERARTEAATAQAVQAFIEGIFRTNSGDQADAQKARDATARELLDLGVQRIERELHDAPEARVRLLGLLADMYMDMRLFAKAAELQRQRAEAARRIWGPASAQTAAALGEQARALTEVGEVEHGARLLGEARAILDRLGEHDSAARFAVEVTMAVNARYRSSEQANEAARRAVAIARHWPPSKELVRALFVEAASAIDLGRHEAARAAMQEAIRLVEGNAELGRSRLVRLYGVLGDAQTFLGHLDDALASRRRALDLARNTPGTPALEAHDAAFWLADFLAAHGQPRESPALTRPAYEWARAGQSDNPMRAAMMTVVHGRFLGLNGHIDESLAVLDEAARHLDGRATGADIRGVALMARAHALSEQGRHAQAATAAREAVDVFTAMPDYEDVLLQAARTWRAVQLAAGRADAAWADYQAEQTRLKGRRIARAPEPAVFQLESAQLLLATGDSEAARRTAEQVLNEVEARASRQFTRQIEADASLVLGRALMHHGQHAPALPRLQRALELHRQVYDEQRSLTVADTLLALAQCQRALGDGRAAAAAVAEARRIHATHSAVAEHHRAPLRQSVWNATDVPPPRAPGGG